MREVRKLRPTLWRTCRAMMNPARLQLMRAVLRHDGEFCVRDFARELGLSDAVASIYLRQLNARGLLGVRRDRIKVFYNTSPDRSLPKAMEIQQALKEYFQRDLGMGWETEVMTILRAFSHFNRLAILIRLAEGPAGLDQLREAMGVCVKSIYHHLSFLASADLIATETMVRQPTVFFLRPPVHPISRVLLKVALDGVKAGERYFNPSGNGGIDPASAAVFRKVSRAEGVHAGNWQVKRAMKPRKGHMSRKVVKALSEA